MVFKDEKEESEKQQSADELLELTAANLAEMIVQDAKNNERQLLPHDVEKERAKLEFIKTLQRSKETLENGVHELFKALAVLSKSDATLFSSKLGNELAELVQFCSSLDDEEELEKYAKATLEDKSVQELCNISNETLVHFYNAAAYLYAREQYEQALAVFAVLILLNPKHSQFWLGSGNAAYFLHQYPIALQAYTMCAITNPFELRCHLYASRCHEALGQIDQAINALDLGLITIIDQAVEAHVREALDKERVRLVNKQNRGKD